VQHGGPEHSNAQHPFADAEPDGGALAEPNACPNRCAPSLVSSSDLGTQCRTFFDCADSWPIVSGSKRATNVCASRLAPNEHADVFTVCSAVICPVVVPVGLAVFDIAHH
jgi:hypothetical protein